MYEELVKRLRETSCGAEDTLWWQAADAIEELSLVAESNRRNAKAWADTAAAAVEQIPRWIPVTERLPEEIALAVNALPGTYGYQEYLIGYIYEDDISDSGYSCESEGEILMNVTHWMPLPEPPKEEAK